MVEDVAVEHPLPWIIVITNDDSRGGVFGDVEHVLPRAVRLGNSIPIEHLKLEAVQMERVVHSDDVLDLPDLRCADLRADVNARHVHCLAVDHALAENDRPDSRDFAGVERSDFAERGWNRDWSDSGLARGLESQQ